MITCTKRLEWDSAHRIVGHESKCSTLHGHRYAAEITCAGPLDGVGRVVDFGAIKARVGTWIDEHFDHTTIVNALDKDLRAFLEREAEAGKRSPYVLPAEPTAENLAAELLRVASELLASAEIRVVRVRLYETPTCWADAEQP